MATYASSPDITVLENSATAQAVKDINVGGVAGVALTGVNYWNDGSKTVSGITSDKKASVMMKETSTQIEIVVSDPTHLNTGNIVIGVNKAVSSVSSKDAEVTVNSMNTIQITVNVNGSSGKTFKVVFNK
jgi:hyaluronate lyase